MGWHLAAAGWAILAVMFLPAKIQADTAPATHDRAAVKALMAKKLAYMTKVHEGMAREDFKLVADNLKSLREIAASATWAMIRTDDYQRYSRHFQDAVQDLEEHTKKSDAAGAALPYLRLTMACVECHRNVRSQISK